MAEITLDDISHLADLTRLTLSEEEKKQFATQLPAIVKFVEQLQEVKTEGTAIKEPIDVEQMRPDEVSSENLTPADLAKLAPQWEGEHLVVPAVFGQEQDA